jgi:DNA-binding MarR family transcriptional regulator
VQRETGPDDRRFVTLALTSDGRKVAQQIIAVESRMYEGLDQLTSGQPIEQTLRLLRALANGSPAGQALARRRGTHGAG